MSHHPDDDMGYCRHCLWIRLPPPYTSTCAYQGQLSSRTRMVRMQPHSNTSQMSMSYGRCHFPAPHVIPLVGCVLLMRPAKRPIKRNASLLHLWNGNGVYLSVPVNCCNLYLEKIRDLGPDIFFYLFLIFSYALLVAKWSSPGVCAPPSLSLAVLSFLIQFRFLQQASGDNNTVSMSIPNARQLSHHTHPLFPPRLLSSLSVSCSIYLALLSPLF